MPPYSASSFGHSLRSPTSFGKPKRKAKRKRVKLESFPSLEKKADKAFASYIRDMYNNTCVTCGSKSHPTCSHLISRVKRSVRFDVENCACQCRNCNFRHEYYPEFFTSWFIEKYGAEAYKKLVEKSNKITKLTRDELKKIIEVYSI